MKSIYVFKDGKLVMGINEPQNYEVNEKALVVYGSSGNVASVFNNRDGWTHIEIHR